MKRFIDLFAGAGGLSEGLSEAGLHCLFANEVMPQYAQTYMRNHIGTKVLTSDIRDVDANDILHDLDLQRGELDLIAGGSPCQGYSINAPVRSNDDSRNHLFRITMCFMEMQQNNSAIEVQTIDTTGNYQSARKALIEGRQIL